MHVPDPPTTFLVRRPAGSESGTRPRAPGRKSQIAPSRHLSSGANGRRDAIRVRRTSLYDAKGKMRDPSALDHLRALQVDRAGP
jgi:hypothetical protein